MIRRRPGPAPSVGGDADDVLEGGLEGAGGRRRSGRAPGLESGQPLADVDGRPQRIDPGAEPGVGAVDRFGQAGLQVADLLGQPRVQAPDRLAQPRVQAVDFLIDRAPRGPETPS
jgi:hypothetical protein